MIEFDLSEVQEAIFRFEAETVKGTQDAVDKAARAGVAEDKATKRYQDRTGDLSGRANATTPRMSARGAESFMLWPSSYASYVDGGTKQHVIQARRAPRLAFFSPRFGGWCFPFKVLHPGTRPTGFAGVAYSKAESFLQAEIERVVARASAHL